MPRSPADLLAPTPPRPALDILDATEAEGFRLGHSPDSPLQGRPPAVIRNAEADERERYLQDVLVELTRVRWQAETSRQERLQEMSHHLVDTARLEQQELDRQHRVAQQRSTEGWQREYRERTVMQRHQGQIAADRLLHDAERSHRQEIEYATRMHRKSIREAQQAEWHDMWLAASFREVNKMLEHANQERKEQIERLRSLSKEGQVQFALGWARKRRLWADSAHDKGAVRPSEDEQRRRDAEMQREAERVLCEGRLGDMQDEVLSLAQQVREAELSLRKRREQLPGGEDSPPGSPAARQSPKDEGEGLVVPSPEVTPVRKRRGTHIGVSLQWGQGSGDSDSSDANPLQQMREITPLQPRRRPGLLTSPRGGWGVVDEVIRRQQCDREAEKLIRAKIRIDGAALDKEMQGPRQGAVPLTPALPPAARPGPTFESAWAGATTTPAVPHHRPSFSGPVLQAQPLQSTREQPTRGSSSIRPRSLSVRGTLQAPSEAAPPPSDHSPGQYGEEQGAVESGRTELQERTLDSFNPRSGPAALVADESLSFQRLASRRTTRPATLTPANPIAQFQGSVSNSISTSTAAPITPTREFASRVVVRSPLEIHRTPPPPPPVITATSPPPAMIIATSPPPQSTIKRAAASTRVKPGEVQEIGDTEAEQLVRQMLAPCFAATESPAAAGRAVGSAEGSVRGRRPEVLVPPPTAPAQHKVDARSDASHDQRRVQVSEQEWAQPALSTRRASLEPTASARLDNTYGASVAAVLAEHANLWAKEIEVPPRPSIRLAPPSEADQTGVELPAEGYLSRRPESPSQGATPNQRQRRTVSAATAASPFFELGDRVGAETGSPAAAEAHVEAGQGLVSEVVGHIRRLTEERDVERSRAQQLTQRLVQTQARTDALLSSVEHTHREAAREQSDEVVRHLDEMSALRGDRDRALAETDVLRKQLGRALEESQHMRSSINGTFPQQSPNVTDYRSPPMRGAPPSKVGAPSPVLEELLRSSLPATGGAVESLSAELHRTREQLASLGRPPSPEGSLQGSCRGDFTPTKRAPTRSMSSAAPLSPVRQSQRFPGMAELEAARRRTDEVLRMTDLAR
eukprot:Hpha_TRINITY_DN16500_c1_g3::TRINITY_DN16500_c1_g3_i1::g.132375::m.132375